MCIALVAVLLKFHKYTHVKLTLEWVLISVNFDPKWAYVRSLPDFMGSIHY